MLEHNLVISDVGDFFAELDNSFRILWRNISLFLGAIHNTNMTLLNVIFVSNMFSIALNLGNQQNHKLRPDF